jgi:hypothetical protein
VTAPTSDTGSRRSCPTALYCLPPTIRAGKTPTLGA